MLMRALHLVYPPQCVSCDTLVTTDFGLCGACWSQTPFIFGLVCDLCGSPLLGESHDDTVYCDDCLQAPRPWIKGRSAIIYEGHGRKLVLSLKHSDKLELPKTFAPWLIRAAQPLIKKDMIIAPIPLHWIRMLKRSYNQSALLSAELARSEKLTHIPDLLKRRKNTKSQEGKNYSERFENQKDTITLTRRGKEIVKGRHVLLVDDVMTSGATFSTAALACLDGGAKSISVLSLARAIKNNR